VIRKPKEAKTNEKKTVRDWNEQETYKKIVREDGGIILLRISARKLQNYFSSASR
jgi:hypothetical protein